MNAYPATIRHEHVSESIGRVGYANYLKAMERESLAEEARRQSELVSRNEQNADWYGMADTSAWR